MLISDYNLAWYRSSVETREKIDGATPKHDFSISTYSRRPFRSKSVPSHMWVPVVTPLIFGTGVSWAMALVMLFRRGIFSA